MFYRGDTCYTCYTCDVLYERATRATSARMFSKFRVSLQNAWRASFRKHLLLTNTVSSGGFFLLGDAIQQRREMTQNPGRKFDFKRTFRLGVVGLTQGPPHHYWYIYLDKFLPGKSYGVVIKKILADQIFAAPFFAITFIIGAGLMEGNSLSMSCYIRADQL